MIPTTLSPQIPTPPHLTTPLLDFPLTHPRLNLLLLLQLPPMMILHNLITLLAMILHSLNNLLMILLHTLIFHCVLFWSRYSVSIWQ
jgi:hypothetical protein